MNTKRILSLIILTFIIITPICNANDQITENTETYYNTENTETQEENSEQNLNILSEAAILIDNKTGKEILLQFVNNYSNRITSPRKWLIYTFLIKGA